MARRKRRAARTGSQLPVRPISDSSVGAPAKPRGVHPACHRLPPSSDEPAPCPAATNSSPASSKKAAHFTGTPACFVIALAIIAVWAATGPIFKFNDTWQLVINTGTTIITFLMVFLIQNTQNRDTEAMQIKLDELLRANRTASNKLLDLEELEESEMDELRKHYEMLAERSRNKPRAKRKS